MAWGPLLLSQVALAAAQASVHVVTVVVHQCSGSTVGFPTTLNFSTSPASFSVIATEQPADDEYRTTTVPYTGTQPISLPLTTTVYPNGSLPGVVEIATPSGYRPPQNFVTVSEQYSGTLQLSAATTLTTIPPLGTAPGTYVVQYPTSSSNVTILQPGDGSLSTATAVLTVQPSGTQPGTIITQTPQNTPEVSTATFSADPAESEGPLAPLACPMATCGEQSTNATLCDNTYGSSYNVTCGRRLLGNIVAKAAARDTNSCLVACDSVPDCVGTNHYSLEPVEFTNCELLDQVAYRERAAGVAASERTFRSEEDGEDAEDTEPTPEPVFSTVEGDAYVSSGPLIGESTYFISYSLASTASVGWQTSTRPYSGTAQITGPTTVSTRYPSGTESGLYVVETPVFFPSEAASESTPPISRSATSGASSNPAGQASPPLTGTSQSPKSTSESALIASESNFGSLSSASLSSYASSTLPLPDGSVTSSSGVTSLPVSGVLSTSSPGVQSSGNIPSSSSTEPMALSESSVTSLGSELVSSQTASTTSLESTQSGVSEASATASARPSFSCDQNDNSVVVAPSGNTYDLSCGSNADGRLRSQYPALAGFNECVVFCEADRDCLAWTYEGGTFGSGPGVCHLKGTTDAGDDPYFTLAGPNMVSGLRRRAADPDDLETTLTLSASAPDETVSSSLSMALSGWSTTVPVQTYTSSPSTPDSSSLSSSAISTNAASGISSTSSLLQTQTSEPVSSGSSSLVLESSLSSLTTLPPPSLSAPQSETLATDSGSSFESSSGGGFTSTTAPSLNTVRVSSTGQFSPTTLIETLSSNDLPTSLVQPASPTPATTSIQPTTESPQITSSPQPSSTQQPSSAVEAEMPTSELSSSSQQDSTLSLTQSSDLDRSLTPASSSLGYYVTTTRAWTGIAILTQPSTVIIIEPSGTYPGTVVIETQSLSTENSSTSSSYVSTGTDFESQPSDSSAPQSLSPIETAPVATTISSLTTASSVSAQTSSASESNSPTSFSNLAATTTASSTVSSGSTSPVAPEQTSLSSCPGDDGAVLGAPGGASYLIACQSDIRGAYDIAPQRMNSSYQECFPLCNALESCQGFSWLGIDGASRGIGPGWCYFKNSTSPLSFTGGESESNLAAIVIAGPASESSTSGVSSSSSTYDYYVTSTRPYSGTVPLAQQTTVTTVPREAGQPGTIIIETLASDSTITSQSPASSTDSAILSSIGSGFTRSQSSSELLLSSSEALSSVSSSSTSQIDTTASLSSDSQSELSSTVSTSDSSTAASSTTSSSDSLASSSSPLGADTADPATTLIEPTSLPNMSSSGPSSYKASTTSSAALSTLSAAFSTSSTAFSTSSEVLAESSEASTVVSVTSSAETSSDVLSTSILSTTASSQSSPIVGSTPDSSGQTLTATPATQATYGSPTTCPASYDNSNRDQNVTVGESSWAVRCGSDIYAADIQPSRPANNGYIDCFAFCEATPGCGGFSFSGAASGSGPGTCYLKSQYSNGPIVFFNQASVGAYRIPGPSGASSQATSSLPVASSSGLSSVQEPSTTSESPSSSQPSLTYYVTSTRAFTESSSFTQPTTVTTISPSGTSPGTVVVATQAPFSSPPPLSPSTSSAESQLVTSTTGGLSSGSSSTSQSSVSFAPSQPAASCAHGYYGVAPGSCPADNNTIVTDTTGIQYYIGCQQDIRGATMTPALAATNVTGCFERCSTGTFSEGPCHGFTLFQGFCYFQTYNGPQQLVAGNNVVAVIRPSFISGFVAPAASCTQTQLPQSVSITASTTSTTLGVSSSASLSSPTSLSGIGPSSTQSSSTSTSSAASSAVRPPTTPATTVISTSTSPSATACPGLHNQDRTDVKGIQYRVACGRGTTGNDINSIRTTSSFEECYAQCDIRSGCQGFSWLGDESNVNGIGPGSCYFKSRGADGGEIQFDGTDFGNPRLVSAIRLNQGLWKLSSSSTRSSSSTFSSSPGTVIQTASTSSAASTTPSSNTVQSSSGSAISSAATAFGSPGSCPGINNTVIAGPNGVPYRAYCQWDASGSSLGATQGTTTSYTECLQYCDSTAACAGLSWSGSGSNVNGVGVGNCYFKQVTQGNPVRPTGSGTDPQLLALIKINPGPTTLSSSSTTRTLTSTQITATPLTASQVTTTQSSSLSTATSRPTYAAAGSCPDVDGQVVAGAANVPYRIRCRYDNTGNTYTQIQQTTTSYTECFARCDSETSCLAFSWLGSGTAVNGNGVGNCYFKGRDGNGREPVFSGEGINTALVALIKLTPAQAASSAAPQSYTTSYTVYYPSGTMSQTYTATSVAPSGTARGTIVVARPIPTSPCLVDGYLSQINAVYRVDITLGNMTQLFTMELGPNPNPGATGQPINGINSIAYNSIDNYLYGTLRGPNPETLVRIGYDGSYQPLLQLPGNSSLYLRYFVGDIDANGQYYTASQQFSVWRYVQVNLNPNLPNYGQIVGTGATSLPAGGTVQDWAFVPGGGQNLYALAALDNGVTTLNSFQLSTLTWVVVGTYPGSVVNRQQTIDASGTTQTPRWNALYASSSGYLYGTEGYSGQLWRFTIRSPLNATYVSQGPKAADADGARCITNTTPL